MKDYLHLYLGIECLADGEKFKLHGVEQTDTGTLAYDGTMIDGIHQEWWVENCDFKLILRPLSEDYSNDMTEDEYAVYKELCEWVKLSAASIMIDTPESFHWLLKNGFDLFSLIESGLAIDKTKISD